MTDRDDIIERIAETLKEPVEIKPDFDRRLMARIEKLPTPSRGSALRDTFDWLRRGRTITVSPLGGLALAAVLGMVMVGIQLAIPRSPDDATATFALDQRTADTTVIQFVLQAPGAASVMVVGDFNDWDVSATPLERGGRGLWSVTVPLAPGRYRYSFLVDGTTWLVDPGATPGLDDEFGRPNSVITIGGA